MIKSYLHTILFCLVFSFQSFAQDLKIFTRADFELNGNVKSCTIITDYGREVFEFNEEGVLVKSTTAYNEADQDITTYKYGKGFLLEKRMESYKGNVLDEASSMANFYEIDTTEQKVIREQIISYDKEFVEQQEYVFGEEDRVFKITTSNEEGVDDTKIEYTSFKNEVTKSMFVNGVIEKSVRTSSKKTNSGAEQKIILTKEFVDGEPSDALEQRFNENGMLVYEEVFFRDKDDKFTTKEVRLYTYNTDGILEKETIKKGNTVSEKEFSFQFDQNKNWVKKITTPENSYITRKIEYYPVLEVEEPEQPE